MHDRFPKTNLVCGSCRYRLDSSDARTTAGRHCPKCWSDDIIDDDEPD